MRKQQSNYYLRRCYRLLADPDTVLKHKKFKGCLHGIAFAAIQGMAVDFRKDALSTIIHECLHLLYPHLPEKSILQMETGIVDNISQLHFQNLCCQVRTMP